MANWSNPALGSTYATFLSDLKDRDLDVAKLFVSLPTNPVADMVRYERTGNKLQIYSGAAWVDELIELTGGGTGAATAAGARTNLGLGSMATQDSTNVSITGGLINATLTQVQTTTATGNQNDFVLTTPARFLHLRCNNPSLVTYTGFVAGSAGDIIFVNPINAQVDIANQSGSSSAANRVINQATGTISILPGGHATLIYDGTTTRWRVLEHDQGAWITPTFSAGDWTGFPSGTITVAAGDVLRHAYRLSGRTLTISIYLATITVSGGPAGVKVIIPGGFTCVGENPGQGCLILDNGVRSAGYVSANASNSGIIFQRLDGGTLTASTDGTYVYGGSVSFEVS